MTISLPMTMQASHSQATTELWLGLPLEVSTAELVSPSRL